MLSKSLFFIIFLFIIGMFATTIRSYIRAKCNKPYGIKYGMVIDKISGKLIGTKTEVMIDPVTGTQWLGKTIKS